MRTRSLFIVIVMSLVPALAAGQIEMTVTPYAQESEPNGLVILDIAITDPSGAADCDVIVINRKAIYPCGDWQTVTCIPRPDGTTETVQVFDTLPTNVSYMYEAVGYRALPVPSLCPPLLPCDLLTFRQQFSPTGWGFPIIAVVSLGAEPPPVAHGTLVTPVDAAANFMIEPCADSCPDYFLQGGGGANLLQYVDTGTEVFVYGNVSYCCNCCGHLIYGADAEPRTCTVAVENRSWGQLKQLFR
jgi:hypothetical protein